MVHLRKPFAETKAKVLLALRGIGIEKEKRVIEASGLNKLAETAGLHKRTVLRVLEYFSEKEILSIEKHDKFKPTVYKLNISKLKEKDFRLYRLLYLVKKIEETLRKAWKEIKKRPELKNFDNLKQILAFHYFDITSREITKRKNKINFDKIEEDLKGIVKIHWSNKRDISTILLPSDECSFYLGWVRKRGKKRILTVERKAFLEYLLFDKEISTFFRETRKHTFFLLPSLYVDFDKKSKEHFFIEIRPIGEIIHIIKKVGEGGKLTYHDLLSLFSFKNETGPLDPNRIKFRHVIKALRHLRKEANTVEGILKEVMKKYEETK